MQEKIIVKSFGCRLNTAEGEKLRIVAARAGLTSAVIFNTCAVTAEAERQAKQAIRKTAREMPDMPIYVVGCAVDNNSDEFATLPNVAATIKNSNKFDIDAFKSPSLVSRTKVPFAGEGVARSAGVVVNRPNKIPPQNNKVIPGLDPGISPNHSLSESIIIQSYPTLTKGFVQIQNGCDHACTYCIVHKLRGKSRSFPYSAILEQTRRLVENGYSEIVLTGVDIASYQIAGGGLPTPTRTFSVVDLIRQLLTDIPEIKRLRLSSLDPAVDWTPLFQLMQEDSRVLPHIHLSMQSGSDEILRLMARRHRTANLISPQNNKVIPVLDTGISPNITTSVDIICGFPGETKERFAETIETLKALRPIKIHAFPFSPRPGTPAADFPGQVPRATAKERVRILNDLGAQFLHEFMQSRIGSTAQVLMENNNLGRDEHDIECAVPDLPHNTIVNVVLTDIQNGIFICKKQ